MILMTSFAVLSALGVCAADGSNNDQWKSFRGGSTHGVVCRGHLPLHWNEETCVAWRTGIPGTGNSSPVVSGNRIYVTTAYDTERSSFQKRVLSAVSVIAFAVMLCFTIDFAKEECNRSRRWIGSGVYRAAAFVSLHFLVLLFLAFGYTALDYERCPIRSWLVGQRQFTVLALEIM